MNKPISSIILNKDKYHSYYDNTVGHYIGHEVKLFLLAVFTLGFRSEERRVGKEC